MNQYVFGANIIENLTTGMYQDSRIIYREYIQNACDQIDKAIKMGILAKGEEEIYIDLDVPARTITITDNATGISKSNFARTLCNIADSDKKLGEDKGFRGIGRLCGLAYCSRLIFSSTAIGENVISKMTCDAEKMRKLINENESGDKHTALEVLDTINEFSEEETDDTKSHWFKVELIGINEENTTLLDFKKIKDYLSFVAPVPYKNTFIYRSSIYQHAKKLGFVIDEYNIRLNGEPVLKEYKTNYKTKSGEDEIFDIVFKDFTDDTNRLIAWSWVGISHYKGVIDRNCLMRGLRLRKENIQIGNEDTLQPLFKEERGIHYFVGEVFGISKDLIPNSQRDYFNENPARKVFERKLKEYFTETLHKFYHEGSEVNSAFKKIDEAEKKSTEFEHKKKSGYFVDDSHAKKAEEDLQKAILVSEKAKKWLEKKKKNDDDSATIVKKIIDRAEKSRMDDQNYTEFNSSKISNLSEPKENELLTRRTDKLSSYSKRERKLIKKIYDAILKSVDEKTANMIIERIEEELK